MLLGIPRFASRIAEPPVVVQREPISATVGLSGAASEWAVGINSADQALVLSHG
jgi:hypothetical protein